MKIKFTCSQIQTCTITKITVTIVPTVCASDSVIGFLPLSICLDEHLPWQMMPWCQHKRSIALLYCGRVWRELQSSPLRMALVSYFNESIELIVWREEHIDWMHQADEQWRLERKWKAKRPRLGQFDGQTSY